MAANTTHERGPPAGLGRTWRVGLALCLAGTMAIGVWLRWALAGHVGLPVPFAHLRHAHSHLGYFGLLFPLAWLGWAAAGAQPPGPKARVGYGLCTLFACIGFVRSGYGPLAIAGSTGVAAFWLWSSATLIRRMKRLDDPLGAVPIGIALSLACVPMIATTLRSDPALAHGYVSTFLAALLLLVVVPSAVAGRGVSVGPWPGLLVAGGLGCVFLGVAPNPVTRVGLFAYAGLLLAPVASRRLPSHARATWAAVALGLGAMACGLLPNVRPVALGAIHFLILGPVLASVAPLWLAPPPAAWRWWIGHGLCGAMAAALGLQAFTANPLTWTVAATAGTGTLLWWIWALIELWFARSRIKPTHARAPDRKAALKSEKRG
ncbi:MAG: hypothetical protein B7733_07170 [Myxococcales bacterium FL481]|nr:MAG: hypothetical protein B7733_07170 [Myxococcales bacterium FL481]